MTDQGNVQDTKGTGASIEGSAGAVASAAGAGPARGTVGAAPGMGSANHQAVAASEQEVSIAFQGPAAYTNKFYLTGLGPNVRLAFAEHYQQGKLPVFRAAVAMSVPDMMLLWNAMGQMVGQMAAAGQGANGVSLTQQGTNLTQRAGTTHG